MPRFEFKCPSCGLQMDQQFRNVAEADNTEVWCPECEPRPDRWNPPKPMQRMICAPNFTIAGYSAKNGYSK